jgi:hypothetical protein
VPRRCVPSKIMIRSWKAAQGTLRGPFHLLSGRREKDLGKIDSRHG